jgi:hypothetical protein
MFRSLTRVKNPYSCLSTALTSSVDQLHVSAAMPPPPPAGAAGGQPPSASSSRRKAPAPPPPVTSVRASHVRNPSDPGFLSRGHLRSPSDPPPIPAKTKSGMAGSKLVQPSNPPPKTESLDQMYAFVRLYFSRKITLFHIAFLGFSSSCLILT